MNSRDALKVSIDMGSYVGLAYIDDLSDEDLMRRPCPGCNHINWQIGHLIVAEHKHQKIINAAAAKPLPVGFEAKYTSETATSDDASQFCSKDELIQAHQTQRAATLASLSACSDAELDRPTEVDYAPTVGAMFSLHGSHWLMHAGQWAVVRRQLGHKPLF